jgi:hypothetical protein
LALEGLAGKVLIWNFKPSGGKEDKIPEQEVINDLLMFKCLLNLHRGLSSAL